MASQRAIIGSSTYPATVQGMRNALNAGFRWLVIKDPLITFDSMLDLDAVSGAHQLRIEGGAATLDSGSGGGTTRFVRNFSTGPMIRCLNAEWAVEITGIRFEGGGSAGSHPLVELNRVVDSRFVDCAFVDGPHHGLTLGDNGSAPIARWVVFENCLFARNQQHGALVDNGVQIGFHACHFLNNGRTTTGGPWAGLYYRGPGSGSTEYKFRGCGTVHDCRFSTDQTNDLSIWLLRARAVDMVRCVFVNGDVRLEGDADENWAYRARWASAGFDDTHGGSDKFNVSDISL